jgi:hypothetical protein
MKWNNQKYNTIEDIEKVILQSWKKIEAEDLEGNEDWEEPLLENPIYWYEYKYVKGMKPKYKQNILLMINKDLHFKILFSNCFFHCCGTYSDLNLYFSKTRLRKAINKVISKR